MLRHEFLEKQNSRVDVKVITSISTNIVGIYSFINVKLTMNNQCMDLEIFHQQFSNNANSKEIDGETMELLLSYIYTGLVCKCSWRKKFLQLDIKLFLVLNDRHFLLCGIKNSSQVTDFKNVSELQLVELFKAADR